VTCETLFVKRDANFAVCVELVRIARPVGSFISASRTCHARLTWLAYD
jgi:3'-phosphoadenosine 5'-phosphosulfate (PAPS) 3'-phosphatase